MDPQTQINTPEIEMMQKKSSKTLLYAVIGIMVIALAVLGIAYAFNPSAKDQAKIIKQDNQAQSENTAADNSKNISDPQLNKDIQSVDQGIDSIGNEVGNIDKGLNEQQVNLQ